MGFISVLIMIVHVSLQFAPTYHEYVLYSNEEEDEPTKYSSASVVSTVQDIQLVEVSVVDSKAPLASVILTHEADKTMPSHGMEETVAPSEPYDLSNLVDVELSNYSAEVPAIPDVGKQ
jgi:hypothetical protein